MRCVIIKRNKDEKDNESINTQDFKTYFKIDWGRQGSVFVGYIVIILGYYGIIANTMLFNQYGNWISFVEMDRTILIWTYTTYTHSFFLSAILLFLVCFFLTYKEDIPHYGIRASIWLVPILVVEGFIFYFSMFGFNLEPFRLQFIHSEGYFNILILLGLTLSGSLTGMKLKQWAVRKKEKYYTKTV